MHSRFTPGSKQKLLCAESMSRLRVSVRVGVYCLASVIWWMRHESTAIAIATTVDDDDDS